MLKLYDELADWYTLLTAPEDYVEEAEFYANAMRAHARRDLRTVLELGAGAGANASHMKQWFEMVLVDISEPMLEVSKALNPELEHMVGDMRSLRMDRQFDAVFIHDAISYMTTTDELRQVLQTVDAHLASGGVVLLCPDDLEENFDPGSDDGGHDGDDGRGVRYVSWSQRRDDGTLWTDYAYLLRSPDGTVRVEHDRHVTGCHATQTWLDLLGEVGYAAQRIALEHPEIEPDTHHLFVAVKPE